jgi:transmembrane sensor
MTKELIYRYFHDRCTEEEYALVGEYLKGDDLSLLHEYMDEVSSKATSKNTISEVESVQLLNNIHKNISIEKIIKHIEKEVDIEHSQKLVVLGHHIKNTERRSLWTFPLRIVASITLIFAVGLGAFQLWKEKQDGHNSIQTATAWTTVDNPSINIKQLKMPDGTSIWLNSYSSLSYRPLSYNRHQREVRVNGEAFFDVAHNAGKPFIVRSGNITTTVLGTAFNVEAYQSDKEIRVILVRGKVNIQAGKLAKILVPGQLLKYNNIDHKLDVKNIDTKEVNAWINGKLVFNDVSLADVFNRIEKQYQIRIKVSTNCHLVDKRLTGVFERKSPENILDKIQFIYGLKYHRKGGDYIIDL